jgi:hypothetical protein
VRGGIGIMSPISPPISPYFPETYTEVGGARGNRYHVPYFPISPISVPYFRFGAEPAVGQTLYTVVCLAISAAING